MIGLLRKAITPATTFRHQLGLGKPLGLGQITVTETALLLVDRRQRYSLPGLNGGRYHHCSAVEQTHLPPQYREEAKHLTSDTAPLPPIDSLYIDGDAEQLICHLGNPEAHEENNKGKPIPVCYPFVDEGVHEEENGYAWFMANENAAQQHLQNPDPTCKLPALDSNTRNPDTSAPVALDRRFLKIGGLPNKSKRNFDEQGLRAALEEQFPALSLFTINMGKGLLEVEIRSPKLRELLETKQPVFFTVGGHSMTLKPHP